MTSPHDALYAAICAHPDEDTPRLAFADLVEEDGDAARAAFIRTQVELARVPEYDPLWAKCRQLDPNAIRGWAMYHHKPDLPDGFSWRGIAFRRGFPWQAAARPDALARRGAELFAAAPVQSLTFDRGGRAGLAALADCPHLGQLRRLEFSFTRFDADDLARLGHSPHASNLAELAFEHDGISPDGLRALAESPLFSRLAALELKDVLPPALLVDALAAAPDDGALGRLSLTYCRLTPPDAGHLFALPVVRNLDALDLGDNPLGVDGAVALAERGVVRGLRVLRLTKTYPGVPGVRALAETGGLAGVRLLDLSANRLGPNAVRVLAESPSARGLRVLNLRNNQVQDAGALALAGSRHLDGLLDLDLSDAEVGDAGALALAGSPHLDGLLRLNLCDGVTGRVLGEAARRALRDRFGPRVSFNEPG
jgi:uncharacterized protein (TIGR02996 family)